MGRATSADGSSRTRTLSPCMGRYGTCCGDVSTSSTHCCAHPMPPCRHGARRSRPMQARAARHGARGGRTALLVGLPRGGVRVERQQAGVVARGAEVSKGRVDGDDHIDGGAACKGGRREGRSFCRSAAPCRNSRKRGASSSAVEGLPRLLKRGREGPRLPPCQRSAPVPAAERPAGVAAQTAPSRG